jgi:hypothetical protein
MRVGISLTSNYPDVEDPRQGARWMIERAAAAHRAGLDSLFVGDQHVSATPYYQNTPMLGRLICLPPAWQSLLRFFRVPSAVDYSNTWKIAPSKPGRIYFCGDPWTICC